MVVYRAGEAIMKALGQESNCSMCGGWREGMGIGGQKDRGKKIVVFDCAGPVGSREMRPHPESTKNHGRSCLELCWARKSLRLDG